MCGPLVNDHHISIQNLIAFLRSTLKEIQHGQQKEERLQSMNAGKQDKNNTGITLFSERFKGCLCSVSCHSAVRSEAINITMKHLFLHHIPFCNRGKTENLLFTFSQHFPFWWKFVDLSCPQLQRLGTEFLPAKSSSINAEVPCWLLQVPLKTPLQRPSVLTERWQALQRKIHS